MADDQQARSRLTPLTRHIPEPLIGVPIEPGVGLVQEQQRRVMQHRQRQVELRTRPARQLFNPGVSEAGEVEILVETFSRAGKISGFEFVRGTEQVMVELMLTVS